MKLILLAGNSISNKKWIEEVELALRSLFEETRVLYYEHWESGGELIDFDKELITLQNLTKNVNKYMVFAKSAGTLLVLKGVKEGKIKPTRCVFTGTAIGWGRAKHLDVDMWIENYSIPTLFIQKTSDPAFSYQELAGLIKNKNVKNVVLREIEGNDHSYTDMEMLKEHIKGFL